MAPDSLQYNMNQNKHVSCSNQPPWTLQCHEDVIINCIAESPVSNQSNREVADGNYNISNNNTLPHGYFWRFLRCRRNGCLYLQDNIVPCKGKSNISFFKDNSRCRRSFVTVVRPFLLALNYQQQMPKQWSNWSSYKNQSKESEKWVHNNCICWGCCFCKVI